MIAALAQAKHRLQLRLAAHLEANSVGSAELDDLLDDMPLLVDLDRIHGGVAALIAGFADSVSELGSQGLNTGLQDVRETEQQRQADPLRIEIQGEPVEVETPLPVGVRMHHDVSFRVDAEVAQPPAI